MRSMVLGLLLLSACQTTPTVKDPLPIIEPIVSPSPDTLSWAVIYKPVDYYTTLAERAFIVKVGKKTNEVKSTDCVYNFISKRKMIQTNGKTSQQVADDIRNLTGIVPVEFYHAFNSARAFRNAGDPTIHINRRWIGVNSDVCEVAATFIHESLHALKEYDHDYKWSPSREFSVPYSADHAFASEPYSGSDSGGCCK